MKVKKIISTVIAAAMTATNIAVFSTVSLATVTTTTVIDDNFNSVSLSDKSGMNSAWQNLMGWFATEPAQRAENDICWKWTANGNYAGAWEQIYLNMGTLKADDTLNISYDLNLGDAWNTKSTIALEGGTDNSEVIYFGENYNELGNFHVGTEYDVSKATSIEGDIERNKWVTVNITVKDSLTSISVDGTSVCTNVAPPSGYTFNQAGVNKIRFMADGIDNANGKNVYIDNVKVTVESEASEPETPTDPVDPTGSVLLSENFDRYTVGQTAKDTFCKDDANWDKFFSEDTSTIVAGETGHGNALELKNEGWSNNINFEYKNMTISKQYAVIDTMFKGKASCNFDIQIVNGESYKNLVNVDDLKITGDGTQLSEAWYELYAVVDRTAGTVDWAVKYMSGTVVAVGKLANIGAAKDFTSLKIQSYKAAVPVYLDEISVTQTDSKPARPKLPSDYVQKAEYTCENGTVSFSYERGPKADDADIYAAIYDSRELPVCISVNKETESYNGDASETYTLKLFVWDKEVSMKPLCEPIVLKKYSYNPSPVTVSADMKANFLGDSITQGMGTSKAYLYYLADKLNVSHDNFCNYGISGTELARNNQYGASFIKRAANMNNDADIVFCLGGTNDFGENAGYVDLGSTDDLYLAPTFCGGFNRLCRVLLEKYPDKQIVILTPVKRAYPGTTSGGFTLEQFVNAEIEIANRYGIPVIDMYHPEELNFETLGWDEYAPDGLHPNENGHKLMADYIYDQIINMGIID